MWRFIAKMGKEVDAEGTHKPLSFLWVSSPALLLWRTACRLLKKLRARDL